jgi:hypothetical protein
MENYPKIEKASVGIKSKTNKAQINERLNLMTILG